MRHGVRVLTISSRRLHSVTPPKLPENAYTEDTLLPRLVKSIYQQRGVCDRDTQDDLKQFGARYKELSALAATCELYPPKLQKLDGWGGQVDKVITCGAWQTLHRIASKEGLVAIGHVHDLSVTALKEVWQSTKLTLFGAVSGMVSCPLAMTDGAATTLTRLRDRHAHCKTGECDICNDSWRTTVSDAISKLTSRDPDNFWTSGQWMTERAGGSDVSTATETRAFQDASGVVRLYGNKFYTSAIDCRVALTLARYNDKLALFLVHLPHEYDGILDVKKLKEKLGTRQLPTAELQLDGVPALLLAERGVANIVPMLQVTRLYNSIMAASYLRHICMQARSYAQTRSAFGATLENLPLHRTTLAKLETCSRALVLQSLDLALVQNAKEETPSLSSNVGRVLSAVVKIHTAHVAVNAIREGLECFGGAGYMEDTGLPGIFRDACVLPVWEGTTDVLSAETMRALSRGSAQVDMLRYIRELGLGWCVLGGYQYEELEPYPQLEVAVEELNLYLSQVELAMARSEHAGRSVALALGAAHSAASLISFARYTRDPSDVAAATLWCRIALVPIVQLDLADIRSILS